MNKSMIAVMTVLCLAISTSAYAKRYHHRPDHHYRPYPHTIHHHHYDNDLGIVLGVAGGLLVGTALLNAVSPPPQPTVVYQPEVVVRQPRVCFEDRVVEGEWQMSRGRQIWVQFPYPVNRRVEVPCY